MSNQFEDVTSIRIWKNEGVRKGGNNKWNVYIPNPDKSQDAPKRVRGDLLLKKEQDYYISMFETDDGKGYDVKIQIVKNARDPKKVYDAITDGISQPGMKKLGEVVENKHKPIDELDHDKKEEDQKKDPLDEDEIPF